MLSAPPPPTAKDHPPRDQGSGEAPNQGVWPLAPAVVRRPPPPPPPAASLPPTGERKLPLRRPPRSGSRAPRSAPSPTRPSDEAAPPSSTLSPPGEAVPPSPSIATRAGRMVLSSSPPVSPPRPVTSLSARSPSANSKSSLSFITFPGRLVILYWAA
ncbi:unnamed protein product [Penicillium olsonii]|nr:unnamed protein product [Penicillium olsonii]